MSGVQRRLPIGAELTSGGVHFRVWAPRRRDVQVVFEDGGENVRLAPEPGGYFSGIGFFMRVSTAQSAVTQATCGATCLPDSAWAAWIWAW